MRLKLDVAEMAEEFFEDAHLLGIVAPIKDYQFCWLLNNRLRIRFRINNDMEIQMTRKNRNYYFPIYEYAEPNLFRSHYLYKNQHDGEFLLPEFRHLDFIWLIKGENVEAGLIPEILGSIKQINGVQMVIELSSDKIKNKEHLIF